MHAKHLERPLPVDVVIGVLSRLVSMAGRSGPSVQEVLAGKGTLVAKVILQAVDGENSQAVSVGLVADSKLERGVNVALLLVTTNAHALLSLALVGKTVDQPRVGVEVENNRLVIGKDGIVLGVGQTVWMIAIGLQLEQVDDIDEANLQLGKMLTKKGSSSKRFLRASVTATCHDDIRLCTCIVGGPRPNTKTLATVGDGVFHVEELKVVLLVGNNDVDVVDRLEAVVHGAEQSVGIRWEVDASDLWGLVANNIKETRVLVSETVVVLSPNGRSEKDVE